MLVFLKRIAILILLLNTLSACSVFSPVNTPQQKQYVINSMPAVPKHTSIFAKTLLVSEIRSDTINNSIEMAYLPETYEIAYFSAHRWADNPAKMIQNTLVQTLTNTHHFKAVVTAPYSGHVDFILNAELFELVQDFTKHPSVLRLKFRVQVFNTLTNQVVLNKDFLINETVSADTPYAGVVAANQANAKLLKSVAALCML